MTILGGESVLEGSFLVAPEVPYSSVQDLGCGPGSGFCITLAESANVFKATSSTVA